MNFLRFPMTVARGLYALRAATHVGGPGLVFDRFGRRIGLRLLARGHRIGASLLAAPMSSFRYWEFPFVARHLPTAGTILDVASPFLFGLYWSQRHSDIALRMINPDRCDLDGTAELVRALDLSRITTGCEAVDHVATSVNCYDAIFSISVLEHIAGDYDDRQAMRWMYNALRPGGRLIITVPVDREFRDEYRNEDVYRLGRTVASPQGTFFQRWYDIAAIQERLVEPIGRPPVSQCWFGETVPGRFAAYEQNWLRKGPAATVSDPLEFAKHYAEFPSWEAMPGAGVCGLVFVKPE